MGMQCEGKYRDIRHKSTERFKSCASVPGIGVLNTALVRTVLLSEEMPFAVCAALCSEMMDGHGRKAELT